MAFVTVVCVHAFIAAETVTLPAPVFVMVA